MSQEEVHSRLTQAAKRKIYSTVAAATLMALIVGQAKLAFLLVLLILPLGIWFSYSFYIIGREPYVRLAQSICVAMWLGAILLVVLIHWVRYESARSDADEIAKAIDERTALLKHCPSTLNNVILHRPQLAEKLRADFTYSCIAGKPRFFYSATFTVFDTYEYDFDKNTWRYRSWIEKDFEKVASVN